MWSTAPKIAAGDTVILWLTRDALQPLIIEPGKEFNSKFGSYRHADLVGTPYGSKVGSRTGKGFIHVLRPTPELWTMALPHRTQILYLADIAFITSYLDIKTGSKVIEAGKLITRAMTEAKIVHPLWSLRPRGFRGTGSGSFSHSVMRTIGSTGHLWSYEFHETRANKAKQEFIRHGLSDRVTLTHRNVCKDGFTVLDTADSLFLDLPAPWDAVEHAKKALRKDRITRICCFSPCMEQVLRTVSALNEAGFTDIAMYETLLRPYEVQQTSALPTIGEVSDRLKQSEIKREEKRLKQIASGHRGNTEPPSAAKSPDGLQFSSHREKRKRHGSDAEAEDLEQFPVGGKKTKTEEVETSDMTTGPESQSATPKDIEMNESSLLVKIEEKMAKPVPPPAPPMKLNLARVMPEVRGHTSYLTFACLLPPVPARASDISDANVSSSSATPEKV